MRVKRAYDAPTRSDGCRILVDRIWPRGISKNELRLDDWWKNLAPSTELREWFGHDPTKWAAFKKRYFLELDQQGDAVDRALTKFKQGIVTLIFAAKDIRHNNAVALMEYLSRHAKNIAREPLAGMDS